MRNLNYRIFAYLFLLIFLPLLGYTIRIEEINKHNNIQSKSTNFALHSFHFLDSQVKEYYKIEDMLKKTVESENIGEKVAETTFLYPDPPGGCNYYHRPLHITSARIVSSNDDMFESAPWNWRSNDRSLRVGSPGDIESGMRFQDVQLPTNAIIEEAYIQFYSFYEQDDGIAEVVISGENNTQSSQAFDVNTTGTISARARTTQTVDWDFDLIGTAVNSAPTRTPNLESIIQEFISEGWTTGSPMTFFMKSRNGTLGLDKAFYAYDTDDGPGGNPDYRVGFYSAGLVIKYSLPEPACSGVSGFVYLDNNNNGQFDYSPMGINEQGVPGVTVNVYDDSGLVTSTATDSVGNWSYAAAPNDTLRIEYELPSGYYSGISSTDSSSTQVAFVVADECCIDYGIYKDADYACANPELINVCHVRCNGTDPNASPTIISFAESDKGNSTNIADYQSTVKPVFVTYGRTGSLWGLAYDKNDDVIYASASWFNLSDPGPLGTGGIYCVDNSNNDGTHQSVGDSDVSNLITISNTGADPTGGSCVGDDPQYMPYAGKIGLGDLDINESEDTIYTINLNTNQLIVIPVNSCTASSQTAYSLPTPSGTHTCSGDLLKPFALKYFKGKLYVGAVCTANNSQNTSNLWAYVFEYTEGSGFNSTPVLDFPLDYERAGGAYGRNIFDYVPNADWFPWKDDFTTPGDVPDYLYKYDYTIFSYPQPILTDIEFDGCDMILAFTDRFSFQFSSAGDPTGYHSGNISAVPAGDILRAGFNGNTWTLEDNAKVDGEKSGQQQTFGADSYAGPGGGEFYYDDDYSVVFD